MQFFPESLKAGKVSLYRPRVVLIDFESAVQFPLDTPVAEQVVRGPPRGTWKTYGRKCPPDVYTGTPYDPYKSDVWQLGRSLRDFRVRKRLVRPGRSIQLIVRFWHRSLPFPRSIRCSHR